MVQRSILGLKVSQALGYTTVYIWAANGQNGLNGLYDLNGLNYSSWAGSEHGNIHIYSHQKIVELQHIQGKMTQVSSAVLR